MQLAKDGLLSAASASAIYGDEDNDIVPPSSAGVNQDIEAVFLYAAADKQDNDKVPPSGVDVILDIEEVFLFAAAACKPR